MKHPEIIFFLAAASLVLIAVSPLEYQQVAAQQDVPSLPARQTQDPKIDDDANTNDNQLSVPEEASSGLSSSQDDNQQDVMAYERVVLAGTNISINCPHFVASRASGLFVGRTMEWSRSTDPSEQIPLAREHQAPLGGRVKWFRNHVPLLNLNHLHYGVVVVAVRQKESGNLSANGEDVQTVAAAAAAATTIKRAPELNQTTGLSVESERANNIEQHQKDTRAKRRGSEVDYPSSGASVLNKKAHDQDDTSPSRLVDFEIRRGNVNERSADAAALWRRGSSNLQSSGPGAEGGQQPRWYVNKFGELIINRVSPNLAGKYTCLGQGKQSDVLLHVVAAATRPGEEDDSNTRQRPRKLQQRHRRTFVADDETTNDQRLQRDTKERDTQPESNSVDQLGTGQDGAEYSPRLKAAPPPPGSRQSVTGSELRTGTSAFPDSDFHGPTAQSAQSRGADHKSNLLGSSRVGARASESSDARMVNQSAPNGGLDSAESPESINMTATILEAQEWLRAPIQTVRIESIRMVDLKNIPGLIYTKQMLHCPLWRASELLPGFYSTLARALCSAPDRVGGFNILIGAHQEDCASLVGDFFAQMDTPGRGSDDKCNTSILELAWFKDGEQLEFDGDTGKALTAANVRLINFCDQLGACDVEVAKRKESGQRSTASSDKNGYNADIEMLSAVELDGGGPISRSSSSGSGPLNWICPSIGRSLEIDGVRRDGAGHFSCAFRLSTVKLRRHILDMRQRLELNSSRKQLIPARAHNISSSSCCGRPGDARSVKAFLELPARTDDASNNANETPTTTAVGMTTTTTKRAGAMGAPSAPRPAPDSAGSDTEKRKGNEWINLSKLIVKGLSRPATRATNHTKAIGRDGALDPVAVVQTFSLTVMERTAEASDLWSTMSEASSVYGRRKWLDFKQLKRNRQQQQQQQLSSGEMSTSKHELKSSQPAPPIEDADSPSAKAQVNGGKDQQQERINANLASGAIGPIGTIVLDEQGRLLTVNSTDAGLAKLQPAKESHQQSISFTNGERLNDANEDGDNKWQLNNADGQKSGAAAAAGLDIRPASTVGLADDQSRSRHTTSQRRYRRTIAHEALFNYANERLALKEQRREPTNKNGIMGGINGRQWSAAELAQRSSTASIDFGHTASNGDGGRATGADISSNAEIKELITQIGRPGRTRASVTERQTSGPANVWPDERQQDESLPTVEINEFGASLGRGGARQATVVVESRATTGADDGLTVSGLKVPDAAGGPAPNQRRRQRRFSRSAGQQEHDLATSRAETELGVNSDDTDDDLLWIAGQYLYMEVRAGAGSPLFGAEVSVEWSNERVNCSAGSGKQNSPLPLDGSSMASGDDDDGNSITGHSEQQQQQLEYGQVRDTSPFATIDVTPGQNLNLQCTAHALGRLPEAKWYKLIGDGRALNMSHTNRIRMIDDQMYWPLDELDLLASDGGLNGFVVSKSTSLFNNLVNQTFTLVSNLQLSPREADNLKPASSSNAKNLFACMVDADVRHDIATIGVNFPANDDAFKMIPIEISRRLKAKALFEKNQAAVRADAGKLVRSREPRHLSATAAEPRPADLSIPSLMMDSDDTRILERSYWVALGDGESNLRRGQVELPATATTLSILILVVFSSLLGLVFLTLRSYQRLTSNRLDYSLDSFIAKETADGDISLPDVDEYDATTELKDYYMMIEDEEFNLVSGSHRCACQQLSSLDQQTRECRNLDAGYSVRAACLCSNYTGSTSHDDTRMMFEQGDQLPPLGADEQQCWPPPFNQRRPNVADDNSDIHPALHGNQTPPAATVMVENPLHTDEDSNRMPQLIYIVATSGKIAAATSDAEITSV